VALAFVASSSQYLSQATPLVTAVPCSMAFWYNPTNNTGVQVGLCSGSTTNVNYFALYTTSGLCGASEAYNTGSLVSDSVATATIGSWNHFVLVATSATSITVYLNGVSATNTGASSVPTGLVETLLGALVHNGTIEDYANGSIAYPTMWQGVALTSGNVATLYNSGAGADPRSVQASFLSSFSFLTGSSPFPDTISGNNWTVHGTPSVVADPFSFSATSPTVTVQSASSITSITATLNGNITNENGGGNSTIQGFNYGLTTAYGQSVQTSGSYTTGAYAINITGLAPGITYHFQAFATNPGGTGVSADDTFTTSAGSAANKGEVLYDGPTQLSSGTTATGALANLFDASALTSWSTSSNAGWAGIDCGAVVTLTKIKYSPFPCQDDLVIGCTLNGDLADATFASPILLYTFPNTGGTNGAGRPNAGLLNNEIDVSPGAAYRYYMVKSGASAVFAFADIDFIGTWASGVYSQPVAPTITPPGGNYDQPTVIRMYCTTTSATIYYTLDGSVPTSSSTQYTGPITLGSNTQINAIAIDTELTNPSSRITTCFFFCTSLFYSHEPRFDNRNSQIQSQGGCLLLDPVSKYWFMYSQCQIQDTSQGTVGQQGQEVYKSADLRNWTYCGNICGPPAGSQNVYTSAFMVRMQVFYNSTSGLYVAWGTEEGHASSGLNVWTSTTCDGSVPWTHVKTYTSSSPMADGNANGFYGDIGSFVDPTTGFAYLIYNWHSNTQTAFSQLDPANYTNTLSTNTASYSSTREAHTVFYNNGTYYWLSSSETSLAYNLNYYATASTPIGPWTGTTNPFVNVAGGPSNVLAYDSQTDQVIALPGRGTSAYLWLSDDFNSNVTPTSSKSTKLILPIVFPTSSTFTITWQNLNTWFNGATGSGPFPGNVYSPWSLDTVFPTVSGAPLAATNFTVTNGLMATWQNNEPLPAFVYFDAATNSTFTSGVFSEVLPVGATSFSISVPGTWYRVRTVNVNGTTSSVSLQAGQTTVVTPASPTNFTFNTDLLSAIVAIENTEGGAASMDSRRPEGIRRIETAINKQISTPFRI
jgi:Chitobiase/beta-hexosaminidase C-terminal domain/Concanavalin A-like lectin/glucanases superfamily